MARDRRKREVAVRGVARLVGDSPARQCACSDAQAVVVVVAGLHRVVEHERLGAAALDERREPGLGAHRQGEGRLAGDVHLLGELDADHDFVAELEPGVGRRRSVQSHLDAVHGDRRNGTVHGVARVRRELEVAVRGVARLVGDAAAGQRAGGDAEAVDVVVAGLHCVVERERLRAAARDERREPGLGAHRQGEGRLPGDEHLLGEHDADHDGVVELEPGVGRTRSVQGHRDAVHCGGEDVAHRMFRQRPECRERGIHGVAAQVLDGVGCDECVGRDADAVVVAVFGLHGVAEQQGVGAAAGEVGGGVIAGADGQRQRRLAADADDLGEHDLHVDRLAFTVVPVVAWIGHHRHRRHRRNHTVDLVVRLLGNGNDVADRGVARTVGDVAAGQRTGADAHAVVVEVAGLHGVAEGQRFGAAAGGVRRRPGSGTHRQDYRRLSCDVDYLVEHDTDLDGLAEPVGVALFPLLDRERCHPGRDAVGVHAVPVLRVDRWEPAVDGIAARVLDGRAVVGNERVGRDAESVLVAVVVVHHVAERQRVGVAARRECRRPRVRADAQHELRGAGDVDDIAELDRHLDDVVARVFFVGPRVGRDAHGRHDRQHPVHRVPTVGGDGRKAAHCGVAGRVGDAAAGQRSRADAHAVVVEVAGLHGVAEGQRMGAAARCERRRPGRCAHRQRHGRLAGHMHDPVETDADLDVFAEQVRVALLSRRRDDRNDRRRRPGAGAGADEMVIVGGKAGEVAHGGVAGEVRDRAAGEGVGGHADAVVVGIVGIDHVDEVQHPRAAAARERGVAGRRAHRQCHRGRVGDQHGLVEHDGDLDTVAGVVGAGLGDDRHAYNGGRHRVDGVPALLRDCREVEQRRRSRGIRDRAAGEGVGGDADAVGVEVAVDHHIAEPQGVGAAAREVGGGAVAGADGQRERRFAADVDDLGELDYHVDRIAFPVGVWRRRDANVGDGRTG